MTYTVAILRRAQADVDHIYDWIAERSPSGAIRWYAAFLEATRRLRDRPFACAVAPESQELDLEVRQLLFKTRRGRAYRLLFSVVAAELRVLRVRGPGQAPVTRGDLVE